MAHLNKVMLIGRLTRDPDPPRTLPNSGSTVVHFSFAVGRSKKNPQTGQWENDPNPMFIDCDAFTRQDARFNLVELITQYCRKGTQIFVEGRLQLDTWDDKNNPGQKRSKHKLIVEAIQLLGQPQGGGVGGGGSDFGGAHDEMDGPPRSNFSNRGGAPARGPAPQDDGPAGGGSGEDIPF